MRLYYIFGIILVINQTDQWHLRISWRVTQLLGQNEEYSMSYSQRIQWTAYVCHLVKTKHLHKLSASQTISIDLFKQHIGVLALY